MIPETQLRLIKLELLDITREDIERIGVDTTIKHIMKKHNIKRTALNYSTLKIMINHKR